MFNPIKNWLGIEGVKLELIVPESVNKTDQFIDGRIVFSTKQQQTVESIEIKVIEKYYRGKGQDVKVDEYEIGTITKTTPMQIKAFENTHLDFALPFQLKASEMDELEDKHILGKGLAKAAKYFYQVKSEYKIVATAKVKGMGLNPFQEINIQIV